MLLLCAWCAIAVLLGIGLGRCLREPDNRHGDDEPWLHRPGPLPSTTRGSAPSIPLDRPTAPGSGHGDGAQQASES
jgi:hypothetical protein